MAEIGADGGWDAFLGELERRREIAHAGGGEARIEREHAAGRLSARERIAELVDDGSFQELGALVTTPGGPGEGDQPTTYICGLAKIDGRPVAVGAEDFTIQAGGAGVHLSRFKGAWGGFLDELAYDYKVPLVVLLHGAGGGIGIQEAKGYPTLVSTMSSFPLLELLDRVPVVAAVMGPAAGASAARATVSHFSIMSRPNGCLFAGGPPVVQAAIGQTVDKFELGGYEIHTQQSGVIDNAADDEQEIFAAIRAFLSYLPGNVWELPPFLASDDPVDRSCDELLKIVSPNERRAYDAVALVEEIVDRGTFFELSPDYGRSLRVGLARVGGHTVGVLATDPRFLAGAMDGPAADKQTRFVDIFDAFHLPILYFVDVPGFMVGQDAERSGLLRRGARALQAIQRASVPVISIQVRRAFGLAAQATGNMNGSSIRLAWPIGSWGDMPMTSGLLAEFRTEIESAEDPEAKRAELMEHFKAQSSMWRTVERFGVEEVIDPRETRRVVARFVELAARAAEPGPKQGPQVRP